MEEAKPSQSSDTAGTGAVVSEASTKLLSRPDPSLLSHPNVVLVTGAAGAIGSAISHRLAAAGNLIVVCDIAEAALSSLASDIEQRHGLSAIPIRADLSRPEAPSEIIRIVTSVAGGIAHLVNNAGLNVPQTIHDASTDAWDRVLAINLRAPMLLCQATIPSWISRGGGSIVNIGSRVWLSGSVPAYTASKAGLVGLTRSLAVELSEFNVTANVVAPSFVDTPFTRGSKSMAEIEAIHERVRDITPLPRLGLAEDVANAVAFLVSDQARFITGEVLHVCGGAQLAAPSTTAAPKTPAATQVHPEQRLVGEA